MGGRGGSSGLKKVPAGQVYPGTRFPNRMVTVNAQGKPVPQQTQQAAPTQATPKQTGPVQNQVPDNNNTPVTPNPLAQLQGMSDGQLAQFYKQSQQVKMPNHLNDVDDKTQKFVFALGMNDKPTVMDQTQFRQFMSDNNIPRSQILSRSINGGQVNTSAGNTGKLTPQDIADMLKYGRLNYVGGKIGGQAYGAGTYFDMNGGGNTWYGSGTTLTGVLNPATAKVVTDSKLRQLAQAFDKSHPQFAKATGGYSQSFRNNNMSIYATVLGYNVIKDASGSYHNVIDRKALVLVK